jgi:hypothetical protein
MTFAEYLRSLGTAEETIKLLDTPDAQRAYDKLVADRDTALAAERKKMEDYQVKVDEYYQTTKAKAKELEDRAINAGASEARARAAILEMQKAGLIENAKNYGFDPEVPVVPAKKDPEYLTIDAVTPYLESAGDGLAQVMDAMVEHTRLFPDKPFNARAIRQAAVAAKKPFYQYWEESFKVAEARVAADKARQDAHDKQIADAARAEERAKLASEYGNPATRPASPSNSPFVIRKTDDGATRQPWARSEDENSNTRVRRATENFIKRGEQVTH